MDKSNKNIIEAGITPEEFKQLFADAPDITMKNYIEKMVSQSHILYHLAQLADIRGESDIAMYFLKESGWDELLPDIIDDCF